MTFFAIYVLLCGFKRASRPPRVYVALSTRKARGRPELFALASSRRKYRGGGVSHDRNFRRKSLRLLDLAEIQLHRRRATEDRHRHPQFALLVVHVLDVAMEIGERSFLDAHRFA